MFERYSLFGNVEDGRGVEYENFLKNGPRDVPEIQQVQLSQTSINGNALSSDRLELAEKYADSFMHVENTLTNSIDPKLQIELTDVAYRSSCPLESNFDASCLTNDEFRKLFSQEDLDKLDALAEIRKNLPQPDNETVMMKVLNPGKYDSLVSGVQMKDNLLYGCMASANDTAPFIRCPNDAYTELRLDFSMNGGKPFKEMVDQNKSINILIGNFEGWDKINKKYIDLSDCLNSPVIDANYKPQITEVGITASPLHLHPEYGSSGIIPKEAVIFDLSPDGVLTLDAVYDSTEDTFLLIK